MSVCGGNVCTGNVCTPSTVHGDGDSGIEDSLAGSRAYEGGESLMEASRNSSDSLSVVPWHPAKVLCRGWICCGWSLGMSMERKQTVEGAA